MHKIKLSSRSVQQIVKKKLPQPLADGVLLKSKLINPNDEDTNFSSARSSSSSLFNIQNPRSFSIVIGRLEIGALRSLNRRTLAAFTMFTGKNTVERLMEFVHANLKKELNQCPNKERERKENIIKNLEGFCLGNGMAEFGIPVPTYALSFPETASLVSRVAGLFVFREDQTAYEFIPLGRGSMVFLDDVDQVSYLNIRKTGLIKISSDKKLFFEHDDTKRLFNAFGIPLTISGLASLETKAPHWRTRCSTPVQDEIQILAAGNGIELTGKLMTIPPVANADEETKVQTKSIPPPDEITEVDRLTFPSEPPSSKTARGNR